MQPGMVYMQPSSFVKHEDGTIDIRYTVSQEEVCMHARVKVIFHAFITLVAACIARI